MATPGVNLDALAILQADDLSKLTKILQGPAAARTAYEPPIPPTPTKNKSPHIPVISAGEDEAIL